jgi:quercetin dioxygenase-like cupin family protein
VKIVDINSLKPPSGDVATFQGFKYGANISFFIVQFSPGKGPDKHRHSYEETFIILEGEIEIIADGETQTIGSGKIVIIPANTWHEFKNRSNKPAHMVNIHPVPKMITEWAQDC